MYYGSWYFETLIVVDFIIYYRKNYISNYCLSKSCCIPQIKSYCCYQNIDESKSLFNAVVTNTYNKSHHQRGACN